MKRIFLLLPLLVLAVSTRGAEGALDPATFFPEPLAGLRLGASWDETVSARTNLFVEDALEKVPASLVRDRDHRRFAEESFAGRWFVKAEYHFALMLGGAEELASVSLFTPIDGTDVPFDDIVAETVARLGPPLDRKTVYQMSVGSDVRIWADKDFVIQLIRIFRAFGSAPRNTKACLQVSRRDALRWGDETFLRNLLDPSFKTTPENPLFVSPDLPAGEPVVSAQAQLKIGEGSRGESVPTELCEELLSRLEGYREFKVRVVPLDGGEPLSVKEGAITFVLRTADRWPVFAVSSDAALIGEPESPVGYVVPDNRRPGLLDVLGRIKAAAASSPTPNPAEKTHAETAEPPPPAAN
ncbi:MAG: hypothetical protein IJV65_04580 [Kiritimatiellae bacterium]|nr:hypothetical protein [Kiritimatiellia bacterium]